MSYFPSDIPYMTNEEMEEHGINAKRERVISEHINEAIDKTVHDKVVQNNKKFRVSICEANVELTRLCSAIRDYTERQTAEAYQRGLDDAWEAAKKLSWAEKYGGYGDRLDEVFDRTDTFDFLEYSPNEAIEKLKAYEEKQKAADDIKVGDEVKRKNTPESERGGIVTKDWENSYYIMWHDGSSGRWDKDRVVKTGRHFEIDKILEAMKE